MASVVCVESDDTDDVVPVVGELDTDMCECPGCAELRVQAGCALVLVGEKSAMRPSLPCITPLSGLASPRCALVL